MNGASNESALAAPTACMGERQTPWHARRCLRGAPRFDKCACTAGMGGFKPNIRTGGIRDAHADERGRAYVPCMTKPDRFKEEISWLKALGAVLFAGVTSLLVWLVQNYDSLTRVGLLMV